MRYKTPELFVSTITPMDKTNYLFETAVASPEYNDGHCIIVEKYQSEKEAKIGHKKWIDLMTQNPPEYLEDIGGGLIGELIAKIAPQKKHPRCRIYQIKSEEELEKLLLTLKAKALEIEFDLEEVQKSIANGIFPDGDQNKIAIRYNEEYVNIILTLERYLNQKKLHLSISPVECQAIPKIISVLFNKDKVEKRQDFDRVHYLVDYDGAWQWN